MSSQGFDPKDLEEICAKKPHKYKMNKADYQELGKNLLLGSVDIAVGSVSAAALTASVFMTDETDQSPSQQKNGWCHGSQGWGNYVNGEKLHYDEDDLS